MLRALLDLDQPTAWPPELCAYLDKYYELFLGWETDQGRVSGPNFDKAIVGLASVLQPYEIIGWHCTRLTNDEIDHIRRNGMQLPNAEMLTRRINSLVAANMLAHSAARRLKAENWADEENRAGRVWFCFFTPRNAGEDEIGRFFRHWGGEALYVCHEEDAVTSPAVSCIGSPCLVEANVPIASIERRNNLAFNIYRRCLESRGYRTAETLDYEDFVTRPLPADKVRRVISYPDPDFLELTGCSDWRRPITGAKNHLS